MTSGPRIMKRHTGDVTPARVAFNFEDVQTRCEEYKEQVKAECRQMVLEAKRTADEIRGRAEAEGHSEGYRNGLSQADAEIAERSEKRAEELVEERLSSVVPAVSGMLDELVAARSRLLLEWESELAGTAVAIAEKIIRQRLEGEPELAVNLIAQAVELAMGSTSAQIQLNSVDLNSLGERIRALVQESSRGMEFQLAEDSSISPGGCVITTERGHIDGRLETMLERIAAELLEGLT